MSLKEVKKVHFIGIGGISMSAIADSLIDRNIAVSGSDRRKTARTIALEEKGAKIYYNHDAKNIETPDIVVYTGAIETMNPELKYAIDKGIKIMRRTEMINCFLEEHKVNIAISGTHGKTTTSGMCTAMLEKAGLKPDFLIGATIPMFDSQYRLQNSDYLVLEACEYQANFLDFKPSTILINNIDYDHVDYYRDLDHVIATFKDFSSNLGAAGKLVVNNDDESVRKCVEGLENVYTFGVETESYFMAKNIRVNSDMTQSYDFYENGVNKGEVVMSTLGHQNVYNSLAATSAVLVNGVPFEDIKDALLGYKNALRRFEKIGQKEESVLISDYAHHPTEIKATLDAARNIHKDRLVVIFQPHTFTRTKELLPELSTSFDKADEVYIVDIDPIREEDIYGVSSLDLVNEIKKNSSVSVNYIGKAQNIKQFIEKEYQNNNLVIAMGAGEIDSFARNYTK